ncbi:hypothetical protein K461DRAFT_173294 [Myriangium duriaei CBS 260.36]|uniref:Uncharacterized protein n=1 Tax=Myriangium duriaei CBS 260.36 TaxID=1168546 RepID=A0A9P4IZC4_9PEZI|nr:hypothetical protein K461DRAFT_173294 [Myriangium duriaei CBS 260.36]
MIVGCCYCRSSALAFPPIAAYIPPTPLLVSSLRLLLVQLASQSHSVPLPAPSRPNPSDRATCGYRDTDCTCTSVSGGHRHPPPIHPTLPLPAAAAAAGEKATATRPLASSDEYAWAQKYVSEFSAHATIGTASPLPHHLTYPPLPDPHALAASLSEPHV